MTLASGMKLGPYEIESLLGVGGMGEVYRARDSRLARAVALKILPESFARDQDRLRRFEQESHAVAALNHPNILAIHDVGHYNGTPYLVSELLEGKNLRVALEHGAMSQRKMIEYGVQIAKGLAAAHEKGIVHRDLKPENLFITRDDRVKILDFGLAKLATVSPADGATRTSAQTSAGTVMGTASYMAPEQVRGEPADPRTDIFAFGAVLFEMLTGQRAFARDTTAETMTAVLKDDPPELIDPQRPISPALDRIVRRCLEKDPEQRFQSARDLSFALSALSGSDSGSAVRGAFKPVKTKPALWIAVPLALIAGAAITWFLVRHPAAAQEPLQFAILVDREGEISHMALSANGRMLAFVSPDEKTAVPVLHVQHLGAPTPAVMPGTEGASYPFWSPDGGYVAFFANGRLQKAAVTGGPPQVLASVSSARGGSWGRKNVIVYAPDASSVIWRVNADGSGAAPLTGNITVQQDQSHRWPQFLPDGDHFLFWAGNFQGLKDDQTSGIYLTSLKGKERKLVVLGHSNVGYTANDLVFADDRRQLVAMQFDVSTAKTSGEPRVITGLVGFQPSTYWAAFAVAENGTVVYNTSAQATSSALTWVDRTGKELGRVGQQGVLANPTISPDGGRVTVDITDERANNVDVWIESLQGGTNTRFTFDTSEEVMGLWSRDGKNIVYRNVSGGASLLVKPATGREKERIAFALANKFGDIYPNSWTVDDKQILCAITLIGREGAAQNTRLALVPSSGGEPVPVPLDAKGDVSNGQISPDGKWLAYASNESGNWEVYVTTFPDAAGKWQVSRGGGTEPRWRGDTREMFYIGTTGTMMAVPISTESTFSTGTVVPLFQVYGRAPISSTDLFTYDVNRDGKRFLVNRYIKPEHVRPLTVILNATSDQSEFSQEQRGAR
ncbi:MAG TPA: protein kinase [Candidatus Angelobacter sp.]|jgi:Tol biopolymer transport system component|nr:protein kinase [Candidatus Angelobacter sp.]